VASGVDVEVGAVLEVRGRDRLLLSRNFSREREEADDAKDHRRSDEEEQGACDGV
jgi:hypothetical protein